MLKLTFVDTESAWDEHLHEDFRSLDPRKHQHHRMASKRIFAAACLDVEIDDTGSTSITGLSSWTDHDHGDEEAIVKGVFDHLRFRPDNVAVTYGGLAADLPLLTLAGMEYCLTLPGQLRPGQRPRPGQLRSHTDLALELKAQGRDWAHLAEIGLRLGLPCELFVGKSQLKYPRDANEWRQVRAHVAFDTVLTAMITLSWLRVQGRIGGEISAMIYQLADWCLRNEHHNDEVAEPLARLCQQMLERIEMHSPLAA